MGVPLPAKWESRAARWESHDARDGSPTTHALGVPFAKSSVGVPLPAKWESHYPHNGSPASRAIEIPLTPWGSHIALWESHVTLDGGPIDAELSGVLKYEVFSLMQNG